MHCGRNEALELLWVVSKSNISPFHTHTHKGPGAVGGHGGNGPQNLGQRTSSNITGEPPIPIVHYKTCRTFQLIIGNYKLQLAAHSAY